MGKCIRKIEKNEIDRVCEILKHVVSHMIEIGFTQWDNDYPTKNILLYDIKSGHLFGQYIDNVLAGFVALNHYQNEEYKKIPWQYKTPCLVVHRLQVDPLYRGNKIGFDLMLFAEKHAKQTGCKSIRLDTRYDNKPAMRLYNKLNYNRRGHVHFPRMMEYEFPCFEKEIL